MKPGVYIHIPFCEQRCYYCAFTVAVSKPDTYAAYIRRLVREIELSGFKESPGTIFFGGGTPSIVESPAIAAVLGALAPGASEISLEANPGTLDDAKLSGYRDLNVNRISLGAQSFHDEDLELAGRLHKAADVFKDFEALRRYGFSNINIDLIAGLPRQRIELWRENLEIIGRLQPEHVSIYMLELEERSIWSKGGPDIMPDDAFAPFYEEACERLDAQGYIHYEISNWARPGFECRHNLKYWTGVPYRGFGVAAHSFSAGKRFWNTASLTEYASQIDKAVLPTGGSEELTPQMRLEEAFLLGLRRMAGFDIWTVAEAIGIRYPSDWFERITALQDGGLVSFDGRILKLTSAGWLVANGIIEELLCPTLLSTFEATP